jgi:hypothetical protein
VTTAERAAHLVHRWGLDRTELDTAARALGVATLTDAEWLALRSG